MRWMSGAFVVVAVLTPTLTSPALAQRRADVSTSAARREATPPRRNAVPQPTAPAPTTAGPQWSAFAGVASGDGVFDMGLALGGTGRWRQSSWPVGVRGDAYFAHHSGAIGAPFGGYDVSINMFGVSGSAEYAFPTASKLKPYAFGGLGLFYKGVSLENDGFFEDNAYDNSTDLGLGIGGGLHFTDTFGLELRFMDVGGFGTIPILAVLHF